MWKIFNQKINTIVIVFHSPSLVLLKLTTASIAAPPSVTVHVHDKGNAISQTKPVILGENVVLVRV